MKAIYFEDYLEHWIAQQLDISSGISVETICSRMGRHQMKASGVRSEMLNLPVQKIVLLALQKMENAGFAVCESRNGKPMLFYRMKGFRMVDSHIYLGTLDIIRIAG